MQHRRVRRAGQQSRRIETASSRIQKREQVEEEGLSPCIWHCWWAVSPEEWTRQWWVHGFWWNSESKIWIRVGLGEKASADSALKKIYCEGEQRNDLGAWCGCLTGFFFFKVGHFSRAGVFAGGNSPGLRENLTTKVTLYYRYWVLFFFCLTLWVFSCFDFCRWLLITVLYYLGWT